MKKSGIVVFVVAAIAASLLFAADNKRDLEGAKVLKDEKVTGDSYNSLAKDTGTPVSIVVNQDTSFTGDNPIKSQTVQVVEFQGKKALKIRANFSNEIRCAFVFDKPISAEGYKHLSFKIAGPFEGDGGAYNIGLLYTDAKANGERVGSFYSSHITDKEWTDAQIDLTADELWGNNFTPDKKIYCLQFWAGGQKYIYVTDLKLTK